MQYVVIMTCPRLNGGEMVELLGQYDDPIDAIVKAHEWSNCEVGTAYVLRADNGRTSPVVSFVDGLPV